MKNPTAILKPVVIGIDLGWKKSAVCVLLGKDVVTTFELPTHVATVKRAFTDLPRGTVVMEVGTPSRWVSRILGEMGFEVVVVIAESLKEAFKKRRKTDASDAECLARLYAADPQLLRRVEHRPEAMHRDMILIKNRDHLVRMRTHAVTHVRGVLKAQAIEMPVSSTPSFAKKAWRLVPEADRELVRPHLVIITALTQKIRELDRKIEEAAKERYPEVARLAEVPGVGTLTALAFVLVVFRKDRFKKNRDVGPYIGLVPSKQQSGDADPQLRITRTGNKLLRRLLVQCAHYIMSRSRIDSDLQRFGLALAKRGGKRAKKRAAVAVARKVAILLLSLWKSNVRYAPLRNSSKSTSTTAA